ncbi:MAG: aromatic-ring-hydroxylating dioxygenase subunit beta, partial [Alphaproteobacteria bacterium]
WIDEGLETLAQRATQLRTGVHWAEQPPSRTTRMVSNVRVLAVKRRGGGHKASLDDVVEIRTRCRFMLYRNRNEDEQDFFVGKRNDNLRRVSGAWRVARREIFLDQNVLLAKNLPAFF